jgi:hypothetical protein
MRDDETSTAPHHGFRPAPAHHPNRVMVIASGPPEHGPADLQWQLQGRGWHTGIVETQRGPVKRG